MSKLNTFNSLTAFVFTLQLSQGAFAQSTEQEIEHIEVTGENTQSSYHKSKTTNDISEFLALSVDRIEDIAPYQVGVSASTNNAGMATGLTIRGFAAGRKNIYLNGHLDTQRMYMRTPETIENVQIEKGHSSILYGGAAPGGTLLYQSKKPLANNQHSITTTLGSYNKYKLALDSSVQLDNNIHSRTVLVKQKANSFIDNVKDDRETLYSHINWSISEQQTLAFEFEYNELTNPWTFGTVRVNDRILYDKSYVYPATESDRDYHRASIYWDYLSQSDLAISVKLNHIDLNRSDQWMGFFYKKANNDLVGYYADIDNSAYQNNAQLTVNKVFSSSWAEQNIIIGIDYNSYQNKQHMNRSIGTFTINPFKPDLSITKPTDINSIREFAFNESSNSIFILDNITFNDSLVASFGARRSKFKLIDKLNNVTSVDKATTTLFTGLAYKLNDHINLYGNVSNSFEPNTGLDKNNNYFKPKQAKQHELAAELTINPKNKLTTAWYQIQQENLLTTDPQDPDFKILAGAIKSRGIEITLNSQIAEQWHISTGFSQINHRFNKKLNHGNQGSNIPTRHFSTRLNWQHSQQKSGANIAIIALSERFGDNANSFKLPGYARVDIGAHHQVGQWKIRLDIENLFNKQYIVTSNTDDDMYLGRNRDIRLSFTHNW